MVFTIKIGYAVIAALFPGDLSACSFLNGEIVRLVDLCG